MRRTDVLYDAFMYPLEVLGLAGRRRRLVPRASGRVLELGAGTGANLPYYRFDRIEELHVVDLRLNGIAQRVPSTHAAKVRFRGADVADLPFLDSTFDSVVFTLLFCSVERPLEGLSEAYRVLRPGGRVYFLEHVRPEERAVRAAVRVLAPTWRSMSGSCNLDRETVRTMERAGLEVVELRGAGGFFVDGVAIRR